MNRILARCRGVAASCLLVPVLVLGSCTSDDRGGGAAPPAQVETSTPIEVTATGSTLRADVDSADPGWLRVTFRNSTDGSRTLALVRLDEGSEPAALARAATGPAPAATDAFVYEGGVSLVPKGGSHTFKVEAFGGTHAFVSRGDGGAATTSKLEIRAGKAPLADPKTDARVLIQDFTFVADEAMKKAGTRSVTITNDGPTRHEFRLYRVKSGNEPGPVLDTFRGFSEPPGETSMLVPVVGAAAMDVPFRTITDLDLAPSSYVMACFVKGEDGLAHAQVGMSALLNVT